MPHFWLAAHLIVLVGVWLAPGAELLAWFVCWWVLLSVGVEVGFHRLFSHGAFVTRPIVKWFLAICGSLAAQGHPLFWASVHRSLHHPFADTLKDPHSPVHGRWHAYVGWLFSADLRLAYRANRDLLRDPVIKFCYRGYVPLIFAAALISALLGGWAGITGYALAVVSCFHQIAVVNLFCHDGRNGYSSYHTSDNSRNLPWLSLWTWGLSLHNNHHAEPRAYDFARKRGEIDPSAWVIKLLRSSHV